LALLLPLARVADAGSGEEPVEVPVHVVGQPAPALRLEVLEVIAGKEGGTGRGPAPGIEGELPERAEAGGIAGREPEGALPAVGGGAEDALPVGGGAEGVAGAHGGGRVLLDHRQE